MCLFSVLKVDIRQCARAWTVRVDCTQSVIPRVALEIPLLQAMAAIRHQLTMFPTQFSVMWLFEAFVASAGRKARAYGKRE